MRTELDANTLSTVQKVVHHYKRLVDGGRGQLNIAHEVMVELGLEDVPLVGLAKGPDRDAGRERFFMMNKSDFMMPPNSPVLYYLQRLRDEKSKSSPAAARAE